MSRSQIINAITYLEEEVECGGILNVNTKEILNVSFRLLDINNDEEEEVVKEWYDNRFGTGQFIDKLSEETHHYSCLKYGLFSKIDYNRYYFNDHPKTSRKLVVHSEDCISLVQVFARNESEMVLTAYMRSSDIERLLPVDLIGLVDIGNNVIGAIYDLDDDPDFVGIRLDMQVYIGSAHIYLEGSSPR